MIVCWDILVEPPAPCSAPPPTCWVTGGFLSSSPPCHSKDICSAPGYVVALSLCLLEDSEPNWQKYPSLGSSIVEQSQRVLWHKPLCLPGPPPSLWCTLIASANFTVSLMLWRQITLSNICEWRRHTHTHISVPISGWAKERRSVLI